MQSLKGQTIVFDLDGTLVDTAPDLIGATNHALFDLGLGPADPVKLRQAISFGARRMIKDGLDDHGHAISDALLDRLLCRFLDYYEPNIARESRPYPGAVEALNDLKARGAKLAVCTNKREPLALKLLRELKLDRLFDAVTGLETFAVSKPHPGHILGTIDMAGGNARLAVMVGDSANDIDSARAAGVPVVGCTFGYSEPPVRDLNPDVTMSEYSELQGIVTELITRQGAAIPSS